MVARCMVETGTSSYYSALGESCEEPVLKAIAKRIAADELRHYKLFYDALKACLEREKLGRWGRLRVALQRIVEAGDDELAYAYHAANDAAGIAYDRRRCRREYARHAYAMYRPHHVERGMAMVFKAAGLTPNGRLNLLANRVAWWLMRQRAARLRKAARGRVSPTVPDHAAAAASGRAPRAAPSRRRSGDPPRAPAAARSGTLPYVPAARARRRAVASPGSAGCRR
jgi:hypothetical protein